MATNFIKEIKDLDLTYEQKLDRLVDLFIAELGLNAEQQKTTKEVLTKMKNYSIDTYKHSIYVAFRTYALAKKFLNKNFKLSQIEIKGRKNAFFSLLNNDGK